MSDLVSTEVTASLTKKGATLKGVLEVLKPSARTDGSKLVHIPDRVALSDREREVIKRFPRVIADAVSPSERRALSDVEVKSLKSERDDLDLIGKVIERRKAAQKTIIFNHHDVVLEAGGVPPDVDVDSQGYYITPAYAGTDDMAEGFVRQVREGSPELTVEALRSQIGEGFTEEDFQACISLEPVIDEMKVMMLLRSKPALINTIAKATIPGKRSTAHTLGSKK